MLRTTNLQRCKQLLRSTGAFQHITKKLRADPFCKDNIATVWDYTADAAVAGNAYMVWYPGDDYVDWWGINVFGCFETDYCANSNAGVGSPYVNYFLNDAADYSRKMGRSRTYLSTLRYNGHFPSAGTYSNLLDYLRNCQAETDDIALKACLDHYIELVEGEVA